jgi:hypothetical protein
MIILCVHITVQDFGRHLGTNHHWKLDNFFKKGMKMKDLTTAPKQVTLTYHEVIHR